MPTKIYEDAEPADKELLDALNKELQAEGASFEVPDGYKCETLKEPQITYGIPSCLRNALSESQIIASEVVDQMLFDKFGFHFLEPFVNFKSKQSVRETPLLIKPDHDLPVPLKLQVIKRENKQRPRYNQVAGVLNEILNALESGQTDGHLKRLEPKAPIQNRAMVQKLEAAKEQEEAERKRSEQFK